MPKKKIKQRCPKCGGQTYMFKVGTNGYSRADMGGLKVDCPICGGKGTINYTLIVTPRIPKKQKGKAPRREPTDEMKKNAKENKKPKPKPEENKNSASTKKADPNAGTQTDDSGKAD